MTTTSNPKTPVPESVHGVDQPSMAALAAELGAQLLPMPEILKRFEIDKDTLKALLKDPQFRHMVIDFRREWNSPMSAKDRIKLKSLLMVEDNLLTLHQIFNNANTNPTARLSAFDQMVKLADAQPKKESDGSGGSHFHLTLDLGPHATKPFTIDADTKAIIEAKDPNE